MEFHEKLQELRKQKGLTQEDLAQALYVSRTAVSKWELGKGYPSIDSLKAIAKFFGVSLDTLLSSEQALTIAEDENKQASRHLRALVFGLLDVSCLLFWILPLFGQKTGEAVQALALPALTAPTYVIIAYWAVVTIAVLWGILTLALQRGHWMAWVSIALSAASTLLFIISSQPYAAVLAFLFLTIKGFFFLKKK